ncbi:MAG TPA: hypothetical protein VGD77_10115 [Gemmatimonadaceae bacterium]
MPYESYWIAGDATIARVSWEAGPAEGELRQLRELLARLSAIATRAELLRAVSACVEGFIGASTFGVLERSAGRGVATLTWGRGDEALLRRVAGHARVRETLRYGTSHTGRVSRDGPAASPALAEPVASIPFWGMGGNVCGALVVAELLPPKCQLDSQDQRILTLLASEVGRLLCTLAADDRAEGVA